MKGRKLYVSPPTTAIVVSSSRPPSPRRCSRCSSQTAGPPSLRMVFQAKVRTRKVVKNGSTTRPSRRFLSLPARKAMKYASGYPSASPRSVAASA